MKILGIWKIFYNFFLEYDSFLDGVLGYLAAAPTPNPTVSNFPIVNLSPLLYGYDDLGSWHCLAHPRPKSLASNHSNPSPPPSCCCLSSSLLISVIMALSFFTTKGTEGIRFVIDKEYVSSALMDNTNLLDLKNWMRWISIAFSSKFYLDLLFLFLKFLYLVWLNCEYLWIFSSITNLWVQ